MINELFEDFKTIDKSDKGKVGKSLNELKNFAQNIFEDRKARFERKDTIKADADYTLPGRTYNIGTKHLITQALEEITSIFERIGFDVYE